MEDAIQAIKPLMPNEFAKFQSFILKEAGISMSDSKLALVAGRLGKRVRHHGLASYEAYFKFILSPENKGEKQTAIDLLTTNETHFFREPKHFDFLRDVVIPNRVKGRNFRVWSAASSSGEEVYTLGMVLSEHIPAFQWELIGSDISTAVLAKAKLGSYPMQRAEEIPQMYLKKYCLKGVGAAEGTILMTKELRQQVQFMEINLIEQYPDIGEFDVIFLRNVMIYFNQATKVEILKKMVSKLRPGGYFFISHSESLNGITNELTPIRASVYRKP